MRFLLALVVTVHATVIGPVEEEDVPHTLYNECMAAWSGRVRAFNSCFGSMTVNYGGREIEFKRFGEESSTKAFERIKLKELEFFCAENTLHELIPWMFRPRLDVVYPESLEYCRKTGAGIMAHADTVMLHELMLSKSPKFYPFIADSLEILKTVHTHGLVTGSQPILSEHEGRLVFKSLGEPRFFLDSRGHALKDLQYAPKDDLMILVRKIIGGSASRQMSRHIVWFMDAVYKTRRDLVFAYDTWIRYFRESAVDDFKPLSFLPSVEMPRGVRTYWEEFEACTGSIAGMGGSIEGDEEDDEYCPLTAFSASIGDTNEEIVEFEARDTCLSGSTAFACRSEDRKYIFKIVSKYKGSVQEVCSEKALLTAINGLEGSAPHVFPIRSERRLLSDECLSVSMVMENMGGFELSTVVESLRTGCGLYMLLARMFEVLKLLHTAGFVHTDLHAGNWVYSDSADILGSLGLIDFGFAKPLFDRDGSLNTFINGLAPLIPNDLQFVIDKRMLSDPNLREMFIELEAIGLWEIPRYDVWIDHLRSLCSPQLMGALAT